MSFRSFFVAAALAAAGAAHAQSTPVEQWQIIEGKGLTDNYAYLGMTRKEVVALTPNSSCKGKVSPCSIAALNQSDTPILTFYFNSKNKVVKIDVNQGGRAIQWPTKAGAVDTMTAEQVQGLYPGSTLVRDSSGDTTVTAAKQGYVFSQDFSCAPFEPCGLLVLHTIVKPTKAQ